MRSPWEAMHAIDRIYTDRPFYGVRRIWKTLRDDGYLVNRKRVHRLMQLMGLQAIYPCKRLSLPDQAHRVSLSAAGGDGAATRTKRGAPTSRICACAAASFTW